MCIKDGKRRYFRVDAYEGTPLCLKEGFELDLYVIVCINKIQLSESVLKRGN